MPGFSLNDLFRKLSKGITENDVRAAAEQDELTLELAKTVMESGNVEELRRIVEKGADVNSHVKLKLATSHGTEQIIIDQLSIAILSCSSENILFLLSQGADPTNTLIADRDLQIKPLDFLLIDTWEQYTDEQLEKILKESIRAAKALGHKAEDLLTENTLFALVRRGTGQMVKDFINEEIEFTSEHFVLAARSPDKPHAGLSILKALYPSVIPNINVFHSNGGNAGHAALLDLDLEKFKWLIENGLDKNALTRNGKKESYFHILAKAPLKNPKDLEDMLACASYLLKIGVPANQKNAQGRTPVDEAFRPKNTNIAFAIALLEADPSLLFESTNLYDLSAPSSAGNAAYLFLTIFGIYENKASGDDVSRMLRLYEKNNLLDAETLRDAMDTVLRVAHESKSTMQLEYISTCNRIANELISYGKIYGYAPSEAEKREIAALSAIDSRINGYSSSFTC